MIDDPEVIELLRDDPELLAIADAVQQTQQPLSARRRSRWRAGAGFGIAACLAVIAAAGAFVLRPSANAGIADGKYVRVVFVRDDPSSLVVSLADGRRRPQVHRDEVWIRSDGGLAYSLASIDGRPVETQTGTATSGSSSSGPVRLSPDLRTTEGVEPLVAVYGGVVAALRQGGRIVAGPSRIFGHRVRWLGFGFGDGTRRIALDVDSGVPVAVRDLTNDTATRIVSYGESGKPTLPKLHRMPGGEAISSPGISVSPPRAAAALPGAVWAGGSAGGLRLEDLRLETLTQQGVRGSRRGIELRYGQRATTPSLFTPYLYISQAATPDAAYAFPQTAELPRPGFMLVTSPALEARTKSLTAFVRIRGLYLRIQTNLHVQQLRAIVQRLQPLR